MTQLPTFQNYGNYSSDNYGAHTLQIFLGGLTLYYSYKTIVAYYDILDGQVVCENSWGVTTRKHLNWIDGGDKKNRKSSKVFDAMLEAAIARHIK